LKLIARENTLAYFAKKSVTNLKTLYIIDSGTCAMKLLLQ